MLEEEALTSWICDTLENDSTLMGMLNGGIVGEAFRGTSASPFVAVQRLDVEDLMVIGLHRVWTDTVYHVWAAFHWRGSGRPDRTEVDEIAQRIDDLLHDAEDTTADFSIHSFREEPEPTPVVVEPQGGLWLQSGGLYRLRAAAV